MVRYGKGSGKNMPKDWNSHHLVIYGFATTADGQKSSPTLGVLKSEEL